MTAELERKRWDLLVLDIGIRTARVRRRKSHKLRRLLIRAVTIAIALVAAGTALAALDWAPGLIRVLLALVTLAGAASGVLSTHGAAGRLQGGVNGATDAMNQANLSDGALTTEIKQASEWRASDCLKSRGWDAMPRFMFGH